MLKINSITLNDEILYFYSNTKSNIQINNPKDLINVSNICRLNCLSMIKYAGSGHIGTSFSAAEIMTCMKFISTFHVDELEVYKDSIFFSSKGHDAPMLYAVMHAFGELSDEELLTLRKFNGLPGHPTIDTSGVVTNTGSLGMGISKAKGMVYANRINGVSKKVIVMLGDGELQEGQIWEAMPGAARDVLTDLVVIVDANGIQSDSWVSNTLDLGNVKSRVESYGWAYLECNGNSVDSLLDALKSSNLLHKPTWIHAQTMKGSGVTFMEKFPKDGDYYQYHSGAPNSIDYKEAINELRGKLELNYEVKNRFDLVELKTSRSQKYYEPEASINSVVFQYANILRETVESNRKIIVLDSDLSKDTGTFLVKKVLPLNYIQCGIAEQDMVSIAGGLALNNFIPIVHSFGTFLTMRGYEQIFNNSTEGKTIIYVGFLAGILPATPGVSHQAVNDFPIMRAIPNMKLYEPSSTHELKMTINRVIQNSGPSYVRMQSIGSFPITKDKPPKLLENSTIWKEFDSEYVIICSGTSMLDQAIKASELLEDKNFYCDVITFFDYNSLPETDSMTNLEKYSKILVIENYLPGNFLHRLVEQYLELKGKKTNIKRLGISEFPKSGQNIEVLSYYKLDAKSIADIFLDIEFWN